MCSPICMKVILADEEPTERYRVRWYHQLHSGYALTRDKGEADTIAGQHKAAGEAVTITTEPYVNKVSHVVVVNLGDGIPMVYGRWSTAKTANRWAEKYSKRHTGVGAIRVTPLLSPKR